MDKATTISFPASVPRIRSDFVRSMAVRPRRIGLWLDSLPKANPRESGQQMHQALYAQNRVSLNEDNRLSIMELYCNPVMRVAAALQNEYERASIPLSDRNRSLASFVNRLLSEMANGYKIVAKDLIANGKFQSSYSDVILSIHRAVNFLGQMLVNAYLVYLPAPHGVWSELHKLYRFAEQHGLDNVPVPMDGDGLHDELVTISDTYVGLLMLAAADPYALLQGDCKQLHRLLINWVNTIEIRKKIPKELDLGHFIVSLESDSPPIPMSKVTDVEADPALRVINGFDAIKEVHALMKRLEDAQIESVATSNRTTIEMGHVDLLRRVGKSWSGTNIRRQSTRTENLSDISICIGINAIHYFASGEKPFKSPDSGSTDSKTKPETKRVVGVDHKEAYIDLADAPNRSGEIEPRSVESLDRTQSDSEDTQDWRNLHTYHLQDCSATDESAGGLRVLVPEESQIKVKPGDLLGIRFSNSMEWQAGMVRSLRNRDDGVLELGTELLSPQLFPIAVKSISLDGGRGSPYFQGLLLPGNRRLQQPESMVVPVGTYQSGQKLSVVLSDELAKMITPLRWLERAGTFDQLLTVSQNTSSSVASVA